MILDALETHALTVPRLKPFKIATGISNDITNILVKTKSGEYWGWGAAAPNSVTGETVESITGSLAELAEKVLAVNLADSGDVSRVLNEVPFCPAAKAGVDISIHDLFAKVEGKRLCDFLGCVKDGQTTDMSLGIESLEGTVASARAAVAKGFKALKVKVGLDLKGDVERTERVREAVGSGIRLWADANQGYSVEEAVAFCEDIEHLDVEFVEQPVERLDLVGLGKVRDRSPIPIMVDEAAMSAVDVDAIIRRGCADMVNIKLMKCGGIANALMIADMCADAGMPNMVGCMGETEVSVAAAVHFAMARKNIKYADLDSHFMLSRGVADGLEFTDGCLRPSKGPGLGLGDPHLS